MKKIIVCDAILDKGIELLKNADDIEFIDASHLSKEMLLTKLADVDVAITRSSTDVDLKFINACKNLKALVRAGVGIDNVDIDECSKRGIIVMNVPTANTIAAVELTMNHLLCSARSFVNAHNFLKIQRKWERELWYGIELMNKTLGVIGFGNIGSRVAVRAKAFGMKVIAYDPYVAASKITELGVEYADSLDEILTQSDFITIHTPKTKETTNIISYEEIDKMKDGVRLINCARGGLYNEQALCDGLKNNKIAWLGIDVFDKEPAINHQFLDFENISVTSHLGANTLESQENISIQACEQALNAVRGISYPNALNLPIKTEDLPNFVAPYIELISKMGFLAVQLDKSPIKAIKLESEGEIGDYSESLLTFVVVSVLRGILGEKINYINAKFVAKDKDIELSYKILPRSGYSNKITIKVITDNSNLSISGTIFGENDQRIVEINGFDIDFKPKGKMIILNNNDIPGVIANVSGILANNNVNIADFRLGRNGFGKALAVILLDEKISKKLLEELRAIDACIFAEYAEI